MVKISVIVPVYNTFLYLEKCLDSIFNQTLEEIEVIVINDGSTDDSLKTIKKYYKKYKDKMVIIDKKNEGQAVARNLGIKKAKGEYICFIDSDDWIDTNMFKHLYDSAFSNDYDIVYCNSNIVKDGNFFPLLCEQYSCDNKKNYIINNFGPCAKLIKREIIVNNNLEFLEHRIYEDLAIVPAYALYAKKVGFVDKCYYNYFMRSGSTMNNLTYNKKLEDIFLSIDSLHEIFKKEKKEQYYGLELEYIYIKSLLHAASLRFIKYEEGYKQIDKIVSLLKEDYPNWMKNKYFKKCGLKYRIMCKLIYYKRYRLIKFISKGNG